MKAFLLGILIMMSASLSAQVTNVEARRLKNDTLSWYRELNAGIKFVRERGNIVTLTSDARIQHRKEKNLYLALAEYNWSGAKGTTLTHNAFLHLRYNRYLPVKWLVWEGFSQLQFNEITRINLRWLLGSGPRFKLYEESKGSIYLGSLYMFEITRENTLDDQYLRLIENRMSSYFSVSIFPADNISLLTTTYYQPRIDKWSDYRLNNISELRFRFNKYLVLSMVYRLTFDSFPAEGAPRYTHNFENRIGVVF